MGFHPINLTFRFVLEIVGLVGLFRLGLEAGEGVWRWVLAFVFLVAGMAIWANYRVPGDGSAKGNAPFPVSGLVRLGIELLVFSVGALGWFVSGPAWVAWSYLGALVAHHVVSYDRIAWLSKVDSAGNPPFERVGAGTS